MPVKKGLTLVELLLAAAIIAIVCSMLFLVFTNCIILNDSSRNLTRAVSHAQYIMEEIKVAEFVTLKANIDNATWNLSSANLISRGLGVLDNESIDTNETGLDPDLLNVVLTVNWQDRSRRMRSISLETLIIEP